MRIIARSSMASFWEKHPEAKQHLLAWEGKVRGAAWQTMSEIQGDVSKAKVLNGERVRFPIAGGNYRLIAAFDFGRQLVFIKFIGTHAEYDRVDVLTVSQF